MRRRFFVSFGFQRPEGYQRVKAILGLIGRAHLAEPKPHGGFESWFEEDDPSLSVLLPELERAKRELPGRFTRFVREDRLYDDRELMQAELLKITVEGQAGSGGNHYGTTFDASEECGGCGAMTKQVSDLVINKTEMGKKDIAHTYEFEYVVSSPLAAQFREQKLTGLCLRPVHHYSNRMRNEPELWQIVPTNTLPPMAPPTEFERSPSYCPRCSRQGLFLRHKDPYVDIWISEIYYRRADLARTGIRDFNQTDEYFGEGRFPKPLLIVSARTFRVFQENKIRNVRFEPVHILD